MIKMGWKDSSQKANSNVEKAEKKRGKGKSLKSATWVANCTKKRRGGTAEDSP